jgi:hypothetical protein
LLFPWAAAAAEERNAPNLETLIRRQAVQRIQSDWRRGIFPAQPVRTAAGKVKGSFGARCLPTCDVTDGRFLAIAGSNFQTLSSPDLDLEISVPAGTTSFQVGVFDGDGGEYQSDGFTANWDSGVTAEFEYSLIADPLADGTGTDSVELAPGQRVVSSSIMPDNEWIDFTVQTGPEAQAPSGSYFYVFRIRLVDRSLTTLNAFKVRSSATLSGVSLIPLARPFSYIAPWTALSDISIVYPNFPDPSPTTYDGTFRFYFDVPISQRQMVLWDGDFDHGNYDLTDQDTDDSDAPDAPFLPPWATHETQPEGRRPRRARRHRRSGGQRQSRGLRRLHRAFPRRALRPRLPRRPDLRQ